MNTNRTIVRAALFLAATGLPVPASAATSFTPAAYAGGRTTDNAGDRPEGLGTRTDTTATAGIGGRFVLSRPIWSLRVEGLGEYERYLSAGVRNTLATGGLDGRWRPDERTYVRSLTRASYAPDRFDPRVPYRLALAAPAGQELAPFIRATTTRLSEHLTVDRRLTEVHRLRLRGLLSSTRYSGRELADQPGTPLDPIVLQSRTVTELGAETLRQLAETIEVGVFGEAARADYEVTRDAYTAASGAVVEWNVVERVALRARAGASWLTVPGADSIPDRLGWTGDLSLIRSWQLAEVELLAREGHFLADAHIPAGRRRDGRLTVRATPLERLSMEAWGGMGWEQSQHSAYHATGSSRVLQAGGALGWRLTEHLTARAGFEHTRVDVTGRVDLPFESNVFHLGMSFGGWSFGSPSPETSTSP